MLPESSSAEAPQVVHVWSSEPLFGVTVIATARSCAEVGVMSPIGNDAVNVKT